MKLIYDFKDYLSYLKSKIEENRGVYRYKTQLAEAAQCQLSYLSQVLSGKAILTPDQAAGLSSFWGLDTFESDYFIELIYLARANSLILRNRIEQRLAQLKEEGSKLTTQIKEIEANPHADLAYYSNWQIGAIHMLLAVPEYRNVVTLSNKLQISVEKVKEALEILTALSLIKKDGEEWVSLKKNVQIPNKRDLHALNHMQWRHRSIEAVNGGKDLVAYSGVHAVSRKDMEAFKGMLHDFILKTREISQKSQEEELICFNLDLFLV